MTDPENMSPGVSSGLAFTRWAKKDADRRARKAAADGDYDGMRYWARKAAQAVVLSVGWLVLAGCTGFLLRGEDSILLGFVDGGQRWDW